MKSELETLFPIRFQFLLITGQNETTATSGTMRDGWMDGGWTGKKKNTFFNRF
jgi:hypothetical protein